LKVTCNCKKKENTGEQLFDNGLALPPFRLSLAVTDICLQLSTVIFKNYPKQLIIPALSNTITFNCHSTSSCI